MEIPFSHKRDYCWSAPRPLPTCPVSWIVGLLLFAAKLWQDLALASGSLRCLWLSVLCSGLWLSSASGLWLTGAAW